MQADKMYEAYIGPHFLQLYKDTISFKRPSLKINDPQTIKETYIPRKEIQEVTGNV